MINAPLIALTNKTTGYSLADLNVHQQFTQDSYTEEVRNILTAGSDTRAVYLVRMLLADPYASLTAGQCQLSTDLAGLTLQQREVTGARLVGTAAGPAYIVTDSDIPLDSTLTVAYQTADSVLCVCGNKVDGAQVAANGTYVSINWPEWAGIVGDMVLEASYGPSTSVSISLGCKYPYEEVNAFLGASDAFFELLLHTGLESAYYQADTPRDKIVIATLAVYKHFLSVQ